MQSMARGDTTVASRSQRPASSSRLLGQLSRFASIGIANTGAYLVLYAVGRQFLPLLVANGFALAITITSSFLANRRWTFGSSQQRAGMTSFAGYLGIFVVTLVLSWVVLDWLAPLYQRMPFQEDGAVVTSTLAVTFLRFGLIKRFVFPDRAVAPVADLEDPQSPVLGDSQMQSEVLEDLADAVNYRQWVSDLIAPWLGSDPLEVGSGHGDYATLWLPGLERLTVTEADDTRLAVLRQRFGHHPDVTVRQLVAPHDEQGDHTAVAAINVLEHIPDDVGALRSFGDLVRPDGRVVIFVPAHQFAFSKFDAAVGHVRRYTRSSLGSAAQDAGLTVEVLHPVNAPGLVAWFLWMRVLGQTPRSGPLLRLWDRLVVPVARSVEARVRPPFGQSLLLVARTPAAERPA